VIAAREGARATLIGYDGPTRVKELAANAGKRFGIELDYADGSTDALKVAASKDADVILAAGKAGVQVLSKAQLQEAKNLKVAADVNAVPPAGIEGIGVHDDAAELSGTKGVGIGALAIGNVKYQVEAGLFRKMASAPKPLYLDFGDAFQLAREIVG
jgi:methylene-tetrahydromethanopterin dehydrogenase